jgi:hypothetical protein
MQLEPLSLSFDNFVCLFSFVQLICLHSSSLFVLHQAAMSETELALAADAHKSAAFSDVDSKFMKIALSEAEIALNSNEVPVGCCFVETKTGKIVARAHNQTNKSRNVSITNLLFISTTIHFFSK